MNTIAPGYSRFVRGGIEFVMNSSSGEVLLTAGGYCSLSGIDIGVILDRLDNMEEGIDWYDLKIYTIEGKRGARLIPAETVFDWLLVDHTDVAAKIARETSCAAVYFYRLAGNPVNKLELAQSLFDALKQQEEDIELIAKKLKKNAENILWVINRQTEKEIIERTRDKDSNEDSDDEPKDYYTVPQYLEEVRRKKTLVSLGEVIMMNAAAINLCLNKSIELRETISNSLGTVYAFPLSILQEVEKELFNARKDRKLSATRRNPI